MWHAAPDLKHAEALLGQALEASQELGLQRVRQHAVSLLEALAG